VAAAACPGLPQHAAARAASPRAAPRAWRQRRGPLATAPREAAARLRRARPFPGRAVPTPAPPPARRARPCSFSVPATQLQRALVYSGPNQRLRGLLAAALNGSLPNNTLHVGVVGGSIAWGHGAWCRRGGARPGAVSRREQQRRSMARRRAAGALGRGAPRVGCDQPCHCLMPRRPVKDGGWKRRCQQALPLVWPWGGLLTAAARRAGQPGCWQVKLAPVANPSPCPSHLAARTCHARRQLARRE
jgi:hypothetical protein